MDMEVGPDGSYEKELDSGHRIAGKLNVIGPYRLSLPIGYSKIHFNDVDYTSPDGNTRSYDPEKTPIPTSTSLI